MSWRREVVAMTKVNVENETKRDVRYMELIEDSGGVLDSAASV